MKINEIIYTVISYVDAGTGYSEGAAVKDRKGTTLIKELKRLWIDRQGGPNYLSVEDEFNSVNITAAIQQIGIQYKPRPELRRKKIGVVE